jgi:hypothetical protein
MSAPTTGGGSDLVLRGLPPFAELAHGEAQVTAAMTAAPSQERARLLDQHQPGSRARTDRQRDGAKSPDKLTSQEAK